MEGIDVENGSSGGAVLDMRGNVIGIVTAKSNENGGEYTYALPLSDLKPVLNSLMEGKKYEHKVLGIEADVLREGETDYPGILVKEVLQDKPSFAKLETGDIIKEFNGKTLKSISDLQYEVFLANSSKEDSLNIIRKGISKEIVLNFN